MIPGALRTLHSTVKELKVVKSAGTARFLKGLFNSYAGGTIEALAQATASAGTSTPAPSGVTVVGCAGGRANFTDLRLQAAPGNYTLSLSVAGTLHTLQPVVLVVQVRQCVMGEVTNGDNDRYGGSTHAHDKSSLHAGSAYDKSMIAAFTP